MVILSLLGLSFLTWRDCNSSAILSTLDAEAIVSYLCKRRKAALHLEKMPIWLNFISSQKCMLLAISREVGALVKQFW